MIENREKYLKAETAELYHDLLIAKLHGFDKNALKLIATLKKENKELR